jgi:hypothetical protein
MATVTRRDPTRTNEESRRRVGNMGAGERARRDALPVDGPLRVPRVPHLRPGHHLPVRAADFPVPADVPIGGRGSSSLSSSSIGSSISSSSRGRVRGLASAAVELVHVLPHLRVLPRVHDLPAQGVPHVAAAHRGRRQTARVATLIDDARNR